MARRFRGEWSHKVDAKGRVSVPAPFRKVLATNDMLRGADDPVEVILTFGRDDRPFLEGFSVDAMEKIASMIDDLDPFDPDREVLSRRISAQSRDLELDDAGRLLLSRELRDLAGIDRDAVFVGMTDRFEIWTPENYAAEKSRIEARFRESGADIYARLARPRTATGPDRT